MRYLAVARRDCLSQLRSAPGLLLVAVTVLVTLLAAWQGRLRLEAHQQATQEAVAQNRQAWLTQPAQHPHAAAHFPLLLAKPAGPAAVLAAGIDAQLGSFVVTDAHRLIPVSGNPDADRLHAAGIPPLDLATAVSLIGALLAVLAGVDVVAGERESGTLGLTFAAIDRKRWLAAKVAGRLAALTLLAGLGALIGSALIGGLPVSGPRLMAFAGYAWLYLALWLAIGVACSALARRVRQATLGALAVWAMLTLVLPRGLTTALLATDPPPPTAPATLATRVHEVRLRLRQARQAAQTAPSTQTKAPAAIAAEGAPALRAAIDADAARQREAVQLPLHDWRRRQNQRLSGLSLLSPAAGFMQIASSLAGTDGARHDRFIAQANAYRDHFVQTMNGLEDRGVTVWAGHAGIGPFQFAESRLPAILAGASLPSISLIFWLALVSGVLVWQIERVAVIRP
jgi:ABC-2 type transport system permease protein